MATQYTTPTEEFVIEGIDLTGFDVWVSFQQGRRELDIKADVTSDGTDTTASVSLTQEQTAGFKPGKVAVQVNWVTPEGQRDATEKGEVAWYSNLLERVVEYGE